MYIVYLSKEYKLLVEFILLTKYFKHYVSKQLVLELISLVFSSTTAGVAKATGSPG